MSKQTIVIGNAVDDGTGDYMRRGGQKINSNFTELYGELGDGAVPHAAGAWKRYSTVGTPLTVTFGKSYTIDTTGGQITVNLPAGKPSDYGKVIRLRDVNGSWATNPVNLVPGGTDTVKGTTKKHKLWKNYLDAELVYCSPGKWEYADNKRVNGISTANGATVARREIIATAGQTDFSDIFESSYNPGALEVYRRGNLLYYGDKVGANTDYGSMTIRTPVASNVTITGGTKNGTVGYANGVVGTISATANKVEGLVIVDFKAEVATNTVILQFSNGARPMESNVITVTQNGSIWFLQYDASRTAYIGVYSDLRTKLASTASQTYSVSVYRLNTLDGYSIRLAEPCEAGDVVTIVTYLDGIASYRSSYQRYTLRVYDEKLTTEDITTVPGQRWVGDLEKKSRFSLNDFDLLENETYNPFSLEIVLNGRTLTRAGEGDLPAFICEGANATTESACIAQGGAWVASGGDYSTVTDLNDRYREFVINEPLSHKDIITIRWYNNDIGTTLDWDGDGGIQEKADARYIVSEDTFTRQGKIMYTDVSNPSASTAVADPEVESAIRFTNVPSLLESIYPVGSIYTNANNPNNPKTYMGFGEWRRFGQGRVMVSWNEDNPNDPNFGLNTNDKDVNGNPRHSAGNTGGTTTNTLGISNIPPITSSEKALIVDPVGDVLVGGCQFDPDDQGPGFKRYREDLVKARPNEIALPVNNLQPYITVHMWIRVL
ncbi:baseplate wedge subunit and tail pin [Aeromonas phage phiAS5]|uniref:Baseplate wedge subunit and tail pin n=1 Tax=Aeromonas phage phiAS5 TaxID=879630 RepID=E1A295_9CAUD|nr:baseplate wedge subunit [Aeromonas phage phiAS5]ADM80184.1 baseplate wedge subunit and tail pin [Aeromonas phage phiAS5]